MAQDDSSCVERRAGGGLWVWRRAAASLRKGPLAEGEPEHEFNLAIASRLPRKRVGAGLLFRDGADRL